MEPNCRADGEWTVETLRVYLLAKHEEADRRYEQRFDMQQEALGKQAVATDNRFHAVNELRGVVADAQKSFMPRAESNSRYDSLISRIDEHAKQDLLLHAAMDARIAQITHRQDLKEGEQAGTKEVKQDNRASWALAIAVGTAVMNVVIYVMHKAPI